MRRARGDTKSLSFGRGGSCDAAAPISSGMISLDENRRVAGRRGVVIVGVGIDAKVLGKRVHVYGEGGLEELGAIDEL